MEAFVSAAGGTLWTALFFVIGLSVIVFVHEYGHYIVGRWSGIHAEVFSIGFGKVIWRRIDRRGTQWQIAAIPFGGYVKFLGDADASSVRAGDVSGLSAAERRHTMTGAPLWARAATVFAGPLANFILTFLMLVALLAYSGIAREEPSVGKLVPLPYAEQELAVGDVILALNGTATPDWESFGAAADALRGNLTLDYTVLRDGTEQVVKAAHPQVPVVGGVQLRSAALDAGLQAGDVILKAGGRDIRYFDELIEIVTASEGKPVALTVWRDGASFDIAFSPRIRTVPDEETGGFKERYLLGLFSGSVFEPGIRPAGAWETVTGAANTMWGGITGTFSGLAHIVTGKISNCNFSGAIGIAETLGDSARNGALDFLTTLAFLSLGIGLINLFPIPVLDGGHLVFFAYEAVARRPPPEAALRVLMTVGLTIVITAMIYALSRDLVCV
jgi:regulator of sigma E protease